MSYVYAVDTLLKTSKALNIDLLEDCVTEKEKGIMRLHPISIIAGLVAGYFVAKAYRKRRDNRNRK